MPQTYQISDCYSIFKVRLNNGVVVPHIDGALRAAKLKKKTGQSEWLFTPELLKKVSKQEEGLWYIKFLHLQGFPIDGAVELTAFGWYTLRDLVSSGLYEFSPVNIALILKGG